MRYLFLFFILLGFQRAYGQKLNGEVVDQLSGEPIGLVQITTDKSQITSDDKGIFSLIAHKVWILEKFNFVNK